MNPIHQAFSTTIVLNPVAPLTTGGSLDVAAGQIALVQTSKTNPRGMQILNEVTSLKGKNSEVKLVVGTGIKTASPSLTNRPMETITFKPSDVVDIKFNANKAKTIGSAIIGYDGFSPNKTLALKKGATAKINVQVKGDLMSFYGIAKGTLNKSYVLSTEQVYDKCNDSCEPVSCRDIVASLVERIKKDTIVNGVKMEDFLNIRGIYSCADAVIATTTATFYTITVCDGGTFNDLAAVQAQVIGNEVVRIAREGQNSVYQVIKTGAAPTAFINYAESLKTDCSGSCPVGYTLVEGGYLYSVSLEDDGANSAALVQAMANAVAGTAVKVGQNFGVGKYAVILSQELSDANRTVFVTANKTAKIEKVSEVADACVGTPTTTPWVAGDSCDITEGKFRISLKDTECGESRLVELQRAYPTLAITELASPAPSNCMRMYEATVLSNMVCEECHKDKYSFEAPTPFGLTNWEYVSTASVAPDDCLCGIEFTPKDIVDCAEVATAEHYRTIISPLEILLSGGETEGSSLDLEYSEALFPVSYNGRSFKGTGWGVDYIDAEKESFVRHLGINMGCYTENIHRGFTTRLVPCEKYDSVTLEIKRESFSQGFNARQRENVRCHFVFPEGTLPLYKSFFNMVASANPEIASI